VTVEEVVARLKDNAAMAGSILTRAVGRLSEVRACPCADALRNAILTDPAAIPRESRERLRLLVGKYLD